MLTPNRRSQIPPRLYVIRNPLRPKAPTRIPGLGFRIKGLGFRIEGLGFI